MNRSLKYNVKKHIPKDWLCELRILYRLGIQTYKDIKRTGWVNVVIVTTMAAILAIFGSCFRTVISVSSFSETILLEFPFSDEDDCETPPPQS